MSSRFARCMSALTERPQGLSRREGPPNSQCRAPSVALDRLSTREAADRGVFGFRPGVDRLEIFDQGGDSGPFDDEAEIAPGAGFHSAEIIVGNIEAADDRLAAVCERQLLVVAQQIAPPPARHEAAEARLGLDQPLEEAPRHRAEAVDQQRDLHPPPRRRDQGIAHAPPRFVVDPDIIEHAERLPRPLDQRDQRLQPLGSVGEQGQLVARHVHWSDWLLALAHRADA